MKLTQQAELDRACDLLGASPVAGREALKNAMAHYVKMSRPGDEAATKIQATSAVKTILMQQGWPRPDAEVEQLRLERLIDQIWAIMGRTPVSS